MRSDKFHYTIVFCEWMSMRTSLCEWCSVGPGFFSVIDFIHIILNRTHIPIYPVWASDVFAHKYLLWIKNKQNVFHIEMLYTCTYGLTNISNASKCVLPTDNTSNPYTDDTYWYWQNRKKTVTRRRRKMNKNRPTAKCLPPLQINGAK